MQESIHFIMPDDGYDPYTSARNFEGLSFYEGCEAVK